MKIKYIIFFYIGIVNAFTNLFYYKIKKYKLISAYNLPYLPSPQILIKKFVNIRDINKENNIQNLRYSEFINIVKNGDIDKTYLFDNNKKIIAFDKENKKYKLDYIPYDPELLDILTDNKVDIIVNNINKKDILNNIFLCTQLSIIIFGAILILLKEKNDLLNNNSQNFKNTSIPITFDDVVGINYAKKELEEVVQFIKEKELFKNLGVKIPRGILLEGPPGTGKTLLARAIAGEAGVPFFPVSGSEFVEMYVGVGASRIRILFEKAKNAIPCIIFIDEIDAIGQQRAGSQGGNDEREQTLNQLLTEMDGFDDNLGIIIIGATNRGELLDKALLRPGRFDRRIYIDVPNYNGRIEILKLYTKNKLISDDINLESISSRTSGFSGADLANLINEAAILTARKNLTIITNDDITNALDRIILGPEKKNRINSQKIKKILAYHESGHAIVGININNYDKIEKLTIAPRNNIGGLTFFIPKESRLESGLYSKEYLESMIIVALGGRVAEELIFGNNEITTGQVNDLEKATSIARKMVTEYGMSKKLGNINYKNQYISIETNNIIDEEINNIINMAYKKSKDIILKNKKSLKILAEELIKKETITYKEIVKLINI